MHALPPIRIRLHESDHERYGEGPWVYDEAAMARLPFAEQREIEQQIEREFATSLPQMMMRFRGDFLDARVVVAWIARRMAGVDEPLANFAPAISLWELEMVGPGDADPPAQAEGSPSSRRTRPSKRSSTS